MSRDCNVFRCKRSGSVVMFRNIDDAKSRFTYDVLHQILNNGSLSDGQGTSVNFSNDIILVSTHLGHEVFLDCECLHTTIPKLPFRDILIEPAILHGGVGDDECHLRQFLARVIALVISCLAVSNVLDEIFEFSFSYFQVSNEYSSEFLDLFNDVLVFPWLTLQNHMAISRLQMRDAAESMGRGLNKRLIFYPSNAVVVNMMRFEDIIKVSKLQTIFKKGIYVNSHSL